MATLLLETRNESPRHFRSVGDLISIGSLALSGVGYVLDQDM